MYRHPQYGTPKSGVHPSIDTLTPRHAASHITTRHVVRGYVATRVTSALEMNVLIAQIVGSVDLEKCLIFLSVTHRHKMINNQQKNDAPACSSIVIWSILFFFLDSILSRARILIKKKKTTTDNML